MQLRNIIVAQRWQVKNDGGFQVGLERIKILLVSEGHRGTWPVKIQSPLGILGAEESVKEIWTVEVKWKGGFRNMSVEYIAVEDV